MGEPKSISDVFSRYQRPLMSEQEIRVRALELAVRWYINSTGDPGDTLDVARRFEAYIRGGSDA